MHSNSENNSGMYFLIQKFMNLYKRIGVWWLVLELIGSERKILPLFLVLMLISVSNSAFQEQAASPIVVQLNQGQKIALLEFIALR